MRALRNIPGSNTAALPWVEGVADSYGISGLTRDILHFIAANTCFKMWRKFFIHIDGIRKALRCSRSSVDKALKTLRDLRVIAYDGQVHVGKIRPVAMYRLSGTPECPLPAWVEEAREGAREAAMGAEDEDALTCTVMCRTEPTCGYAGSTEEPSSSTAAPDEYRPAPPVKTEPQAEQKVGTARQVPHLGCPRGPAAGLLERRAARVPKGAPQGLYEAPTGALDGLTVGTAEGPCSPIQGAVTYCHPPTRGAAVNPFTDPAIGTLPPLNRLLYHGILNLSDNSGHVVADPRYLNSQVFPYDNLPAEEVIEMITTLIDLGKIHYITDGYFVLSDPPASKETALFSIPAAPKPIKTDPALDFDTFWEYYPRRSGKGAARKAFLAQTSRGVTAAHIIQAASDYAENCKRIGKEAQFIPHPATWLNQERYDDDVEQAPQVRSKMDDALRSGMDLVSFYQQQEAIDFNGPKELGW